MPDADMGARLELPAHVLPDFSSRVAAIPNFLASAQITEPSKEVERLAAVERSYVPTHKKGGTIAYATLITQAPTVTQLYQSDGMKSLVSSIVGIDVTPTPLRDQNSLSILVYDRPGDHIDWHYDHNFYQGRHFTVLLSLVNQGRGSDGLSNARLFAKIDGAVTQVPTPPNTLVLFEGAKLLHKVSPIEIGERRVLISMTYCANPNSTLVQGLARRIKDTAFFGIRSLWT